MTEFIVNQVLSYSICSIPLPILFFLADVYNREYYCRDGPLGLQVASSFFFYIPISTFYIHPSLPLVLMISVASSMHLYLLSSTL